MKRRKLGRGVGKMRVRILLWLALILSFLPLVFAQPQSQQDREGEVVAAPNGVCIVEQHHQPDAAPLRIAVLEKCVPLKILTEEFIDTQVGQVCVDLTSIADNELLLTYNTSNTDYSLEKLSVYAGPDVKHVPSYSNAGRPNPNQFEYQQVLTEAVEVASIQIPVDPTGEAVACPGDWQRALVAHARVSKPRSLTPENVYAYEAFLYYHNPALTNRGQEEFYTWFRIDLSCDCINYYDIDFIDNSQNLTVLFQTAAPTENGEKEPEDNLAVDNTNNNNNSTEGLDLDQNESESSTETPAEPEELIATSAPSEVTVDSTPAPSLVTSPAPTTPMTSSPPKPPTSDTVKEADLVFGTSFIVETSSGSSDIFDHYAKAELPHEQLEQAFAAFAKQVLEGIDVAPISVEEPTKEEKSNRQRILQSQRIIDNHHYHRQLLVQYDPTSFIVYDFLVSTSCGEDKDEEDVVEAPAEEQTTTTPSPPPSPCHRAYARMGVRAVNEDVKVVCEILREAMLQAYDAGKLGAVWRTQSSTMATTATGTQVASTSNIQLHSGAFEYCMPVSEDAVDLDNLQNLDSEEEDNWTNGINPVTGEKTQEETKDDGGGFPWLAVVIPLIILLLLALFGYCWYRGLFQKKADDEDDEIEPNTNKETLFQDEEQQQERPQHENNNFEVEEDDDISGLSFE